MASPASENTSFCPFHTGRRLIRFDPKVEKWLVELFPGIEARSVKVQVDGAM
jgi:streptogramin lyase